MRTLAFTAALAAALSAENPRFARMADPARETPGAPRVLLIGDSISIGYTEAVRDLLRGKANVHRVPANAGPTVNGLANLERWLGNRKWDVIHFNWGLHDLRISPGVGHQVSLDQYERNLRLLVEGLKKTGARLIFAATTPVPQGNLSPPRRDSDVVAYNAAARRVMQEHGIAVNDLYGFALPRLKEIQRPENVHFTEEGSRVLARHVADAILAALAR